MEKLYREWFCESNRRWWFQATSDDDKFITEAFGHLLDMHEYDDTFVKVPLVAKIILYDQIPRHVYRSEPATHIIEFFLQKALQYASEYEREPSLLQQLSDDEYVFAMLPFRHSQNVSRIHWVMKQTWDRIRMQNLQGLGDIGILKRFLKATYERCPKNGLGIRTMGAAGSNLKDWDASVFADVLEFAPADLLAKSIESMAGTSCYEQMRAFVAKQGKQARTAPTADSTQHTPCVLVSLSGGVDSMVCATLLQHFGVPIHCVHINYCNRDIREEEFVVSWCQAMGLPLSVRRMEEIQRAPCMTYELRDTYETYTRDVRYATYRAVWQVYAGKHDSELPRVVLGHNEDDCFENVLTNIAQKQKMDNLRGMSQVSAASGIFFLRPLLGCSKADIYSFARAVGIPYLRDSTPSWSQRGMIRDHVRPTLHKWHPRVVQELLGLADHVHELYGFMDDMIDSVLQKKQNQNEKEIKIKLPLHMRCIESLLFWKHMIAKALSQYPSQRSLTHFVTRLGQILEKSHGTRALTTNKRIVLSQSVTIWVRVVGCLLEVTFDLLDYDM